MAKTPNRSGGLLVGKTDRDGGQGIKVIAPEGEIVMGGGEVIINEEAAKLNCEELSTINQSTGGVAIPCDAQKTANKGPGNTMEEGGGNRPQLLYGGRINYFTNYFSDKGYKWKIDIKKVYNLYKNKREVFLSSVITHPELFKKYPFIKTVKVIFEEIDNEDNYAEGETLHAKEYYDAKIILKLHFKYYKKNGKEKYQLGNEYSEFSKEAVLLHEIQHVCQQGNRKSFGRSHEEFDNPEMYREKTATEIEQIKYEGYVDYKLQDSEQEAMLCVYNWLQDINLKYTDTTFLFIAPNENNEGQEGIYAYGGKLSKESLDEHLPIRYQNVLNSYYQYSQQERQDFDNDPSKKRFHDYMASLDKKVQQKIHEYYSEKNKINFDQGGALKQGIDIEKEHTNLYNELSHRLKAEGIAMPMGKEEFYTWIAEAHLGENKDYYTLLKKYVESKNKDTTQPENEYIMEKHDLKSNAVSFEHKNILGATTLSWVTTNDGRHFYKVFEGEKTHEDIYNWYKEKGIVVTHAIADIIHHTAEKRDLTTLKAYIEKQVKEKFSADVNPDSLMIPYTDHGDNGFTVNDFEFDLRDGSKVKYNAQDQTITKLMKSGGKVDEKVSAKYNIGWYGVKGAYIHSDSGKVLRIFTEEDNADDNWKAAVEWAEQNESKIRMAEGGQIKEGTAKKGIFDLSGKEYEGYYFDGEEWNGHAIPYFTEEVARKMAEEMNGRKLYHGKTEKRAWAFPQSDAKDAFDNDVFYGQEINTVDGKKEVFPIGANMWTWELENKMEQGGKTKTAKDFEAGTPVSYTDEDGKTYRGEIVSRALGTKAISLYKDKNYSGSEERIITPHDWDKVNDFGDSMAEGGKLSDDATYIPNRDVVSLSLMLKGQLKHVTGKQILDGVYLKNKKGKTVVSSIGASALYNEIVAKAKEKDWWEEKDSATITEKQVSDLLEAGYTHDQVKTIYLGYSTTHKIECDNEFQGSDQIFRYMDNYRQEYIDKYIQAKKDGKFELGLKYPDMIWTGIIKKFGISKTPRIIKQKSKEFAPGDYNIYVYEIFEGKNIVIGHQIARERYKNNKLDETIKDDNVVTDPTKVNAYQKARNYRPGFNGDYWGVASTNIESMAAMIVYQKEAYVKDLEMYINTLGGVDTQALDENNIKYNKGGKMDVNAYAAIAVKDGYWIVISKPTTKEIATEIANSKGGVLAGEKGEVKTVKEILLHNKTLGREYLSGPSGDGKMATGGKLKEGPEEITNLVYYKNKKNEKKFQTGYIQPIYAQKLSIPVIMGYDLADTEKNIIKSYTSLEAEKALKEGLLKRHETMAEGGLLDNIGTKSMVTGGKISDLCPTGTVIQTLIFDKEKFNRTKANNWVKEHGFKNRIDITENSYRFRQYKPQSFKLTSFKTTNFDGKLPEGVQAVIGCLRSNVKIKK